MPDLSPPETESDFYFVRADDPDTAVGAVAARVAVQDARAGLFHHLSDERHHGIKLVAQALQRQLLYNVGRALHARGDFLREAFGLPRHPT